MSIIGVGYQGLSPDELVQTLREHGVSVVADVRLTPMSRKPGMSKKSLDARLNAEGIDYQHFPALGNPKDNRAGYAKADPAAQEFYRDRLETPEAQESLARIADLASIAMVALLCFEADGEHCHRTQVLDYLSARG
jgi:uncharacterized protein (DUF488 family)